MRWRDLGGEECSVARTVSVIGDRWTLLVLRECFLRVRRFEDFQARLGITRPLLAARLRKLVGAGVLERVAYQERPLRHEYRLTPRGLDLHPVLMAIVHWGDTHLAPDGRRPLLHRHKPCGHLFDPVMICSECAVPLHAREVTVEPGPGGGSRTPHRAAEAEPPSPRRRARRPGATSSG
ncbi:MAG: helix-turn-helix transcriptional regulator [Acetobacteraceae bacterium]|nr:helix-turn-helix transcriptional regulator [Acetobacteraceae bacterium]